jgi:integrase
MTNPQPAVATRALDSAISVGPNNRGKTFVTEIFTPEEVRTLLDGCSENAWGLRLSAYIALLYRTGMEASEGLSLTLSHLDLTPGHETVHVPATRLLPRILALDDMALSFLRPWMEARSTMPGTHIFCVLRGKTAGSMWAECDMRRVFRELGRDALGKRLNAGALRNTLTAELIIEQWPLPYIQTQLGLQGIWSFREIFPKLGIEGAPQHEVAEIARARPPWHMGDLVTR